MILDYLLRLRDGGTTTTVDDTEGGITTTLSRHVVTGRAVIDLRKTGMGQGLSIVVVNGAGEYTSPGDTFVVIIEAADEKDFDGGGTTVETILTFTSLAQTGGTAVIPANIMVRRFQTQKRYIRSKLTVSVALDTALTLSIFIAGPLEEES